MRRFIPSFAEILMDITYMPRKDHEIKWTAEAKKSFKDIKHAISESPMLVGPDFKKYFLVFSYASEHTIAVVLLQKNEQGKNNL